MERHRPARPLSRRSLLGAASGTGAAWLLSACAGDGGGRDGGVRTQLSWLKTVTFAGHYIAESQGYFRDAGVRSTLLSGGPSVPDAVTPASAGAVDVALADLSALVAARAKGSDLVAIGAVFQESPGGFVSLPGHPVRTAQDLVGLRIGLSPGTEVFVEAILRVNKLPVRYDRVPVGSGTRALTSGQCDVMACYVTSQPLSLEAAGHKVVTVSQGELGMPDYALVMAARRANLKRHRETYVGYVEAVARGWRRNLTEPALGTRLTLDDYGHELGLGRQATQKENVVQNRLVDSPYTEEHGLCAMDPEHLAGPVYRGLRARGTTDLPPVKELYDGSLLEEAHGSN